MIQTVSFPLDSGTIAEYGSWAELHREISRMGCDGIEGIWAGEDIPRDLPEGLAAGYHLMFYPEWLDLYREDHGALRRKFGSLNTAARFYGGLGPDALLAQFRADLERARSLRAQYVVFHVSDVSVEEGYTYRWLHTNAEVIDAAVELINTLLDGADWPFLFLVENQWWPGFTFTEPEETAQLLEGIHYPRAGILLDTGHLMNTNPDLTSQAEGAAYIQTMLDRHGSLAGRVRGVHLHHSLSGGYVRAHTRALPPDLPGDYLERFRMSYSHILRIDQHLPWTDPAILPVLERIDPFCLTHELAVRNRAQRARDVSAQVALLSALDHICPACSTSLASCRTSIFSSEE